MKPLLTSALLIASLCSIGQIVPQHITIDYERSDDPSGDLGIASDFNSRYVNPPDEGKYTNAIVAFDSLHDLNTDQGYAYNELIELSVDTIHLWLGHTNLSGQNDTVVVTVVALNGSGFPTSTLLWADSIITDTSLSLGSYLSPREIKFMPHLIVTPPSAIGVKLEYFAPVEDTAAFIAGFVDDGSCGPTTCSDVAESSFGNSYYYYTGGSLHLPGFPYYMDCNANHVQDSCEAWFIQNISIWIDATMLLMSGLAEQNAADAWNVYPNPTDGFITIDASHYAQNATLVIRNALGQLLLTSQVIGESVGRIDLAHLSSGLYTITLHSDDVVDYKMVLKR